MNAKQWYQRSTWGCIIFCLPFCHFLSLHRLPTLPFQQLSTLLFSVHSLSLSPPLLSLLASSPMAASAPLNFLLLLLLSAMIAHSSATWCICKEGSDQALQKTLDYACGAGADCNPIHQNGACWNPNTVRAHCSYAVNSFFQKKGQAPGTCDFAGTATMSTTDPSSNGCAFPASASGSGSSTTSSSTSSSTTSTGTGTGTGSTSAYNGTPGVLGGGIGTGMGPSNMNTDVSHGGSRIEETILFSVSLGMFAMVLWG